MHVFACDYDRTIADGGRCSPEVAAALGRVRESGRKILLVTGRMLSDLRSVCADVDRMFDAVVAENGAVLYFPETREATTLGDAPESALVEELRRRGVPFDRGSSIIATTEGYAEAALAAVRETGVERTLVFNKGALMLVPGGVTKGTGLEAALTVLALSPHNMVGSGDAAYDHALLAFAELQRVVVLGGSSERVLPTPDELRQLLHQPRTSLVLNLSAMTRAEKVAYATKALGAVAFVRSTTGLPHWLILDEAHHIAPADGSPVVELLRAGTESLCMSTLQVTDLAPELRTLPNVVAATELDAFAAAPRAATAGRAPAPAGTPLAEGEVAIAWLGPEARAQRFRVAKRRVQHRRHVRKYTEGELPPDRPFYFRGPAGALNLRAANLVRFVELAEGVDEPTWAWHLGQHDYSTWARQQIKDDELAGALAAVETADLPPPESRRRELDEIRARYSV